MNKFILDLLDGDESHYPHLLEQQFERVLNKIVALWDTPDIENYFYELMVDTRGGTRQGFPPAVASDIMALHRLYCRLHVPPEQHVNVWASIPEARRMELQQLGFAYSFEHFMQAVEAGNQAAVNIFISCGVDIESRDSRDWTPLMIATFNGDEAMALLLIKRGANIHVVDQNGYTPLHWCALNGRAAVGEALLDQGAQVNAGSHSGWTALLQAATRGHLQMVVTLLARGAEVNTITRDGWTALHKASANGHADVVLKLLENGADSAIVYPDGSTALSLAHKNKHSKVVRILMCMQKMHHQAAA